MPVIPAPELETLADAIVATVAYSDVFDMPLERKQLRPFLFGRQASEREIDDALEPLIDSGELVRVERGDLLHLPGRETVADIHAERTERAAPMWKQARRWGARLGAVPWVRGVAVTGGLACDSVAPHDDIDFAIITAPRRLWLARLGCIVVVRLAEWRDGIELCPNFLITDDALELEDQTAYVARELTQLVDITDSAVFDEFRARNEWRLTFLPNAPSGPTRTETIAPRGARARRLVERVGNRSIFDPLEAWEMRRKVERLKQTRSRNPAVTNPDESSFSPQMCKGHMVGNAAGIDIAWRERVTDG